MIRLRDTGTLALTKLRTRKVRLVVTIIVSGLLFSLLTVGSMVARAAFAGIERFSREGLGERFILTAYPSQSLDYYSNKDIQKQALEIHKNLVARKKAAAKRLNIQYDPSSDPAPISEHDKTLIIDSPAAELAIEEYAKKNPPHGPPELKSQAKSYQPRNFYESQSMSMGGPQSVRLTILKDGKEPSEQNLQMGGPPTGLDSFNGTWSLMDTDLLKPFTLEGTTTERGADGSIPVIAPFSAVEQLLKLQPLPPTSKAEDRLARLKELRDQATSATFEVCYRNPTSSELIDRAVSQQQEIKQNEKNKDYTKPTLIYDVASKPCRPPVVQRDVRSQAEKNYAANQERFDRLFGKVPPKQKLLKFRIIGIVSDPPGFNASVGIDLLGSLVTSSLGQGWYSPLHLSEKDKILQEIFAPNVTLGSAPVNYIEFASADRALQFMKEQNCTPDFSNVVTEEGYMKANEECAKQGKYFAFAPFGSNSLALQGVKIWFGRAFVIGALVVSGIASLIMMGTVGRAVADSRRETAVFRAIGAKRIDIAQIYILYTIILALLISLFAITIGFILANIADSRWARDLTLQALVAYNARDLSSTIHLYTLYLPDLTKLVGLTILAGIISAIFPLARNARRNPIRDMRDEN